MVVVIVEILFISHGRFMLRPLWVRAKIVVEEWMIVLAADTRLFIGADVRIPAPHITEQP